MEATDRFAPRALPKHRQMTVTPTLTPFELSILIAALEARGCRYAEDIETVDVAQHWFDRCTELREILR
jgi:cell division protein FtsX